MYGGATFLFSSYGGGLHQESERMFFMWLGSFIASVLISFALTNIVKILLAAAMLHYIYNGGSTSLCWARVAVSLLLSKEAKCIGSDIMFFDQMLLDFNLQPVDPTLFKT